MSAVAVHARLHFDGSRIGCRAPSVGSHTATDELVGVYSYTSVIRMESAASFLGQRMTFAYDGEGHRTSRVFGAERSHDYTYDAVGCLESQVNQFGERTTSTYDAAGRRWLIQKGNQTRTSLTFDAADRLLSTIDLRSDQSVICGVDYEYDNAGNRTRMAEASGRLTTWTYDDTYQLVNEHRSSAVGGFHITHVYDPVGNRLVKNAAGALTTATYDVANQLQTILDSTGTTTFSFDAAGNQHIEMAPAGVTTNVWNYENQRTVVALPERALSDVGLQCGLSTSHQRSLIEFSQFFNRPLRRRPLPQTKENPPCPRLAFFGIPLRTTLSRNSMLPLPQWPLTLQSRFCTVV